MRHKDFAEYIFCLLGRHRQLLFKSLFKLKLEKRFGWIMHTTANLRCGLVKTLFQLPCSFQSKIPLVCGATFFLFHCQIRVLLDSKTSPGTESNCHSDFKQLEAIAPALIRAKNCSTFSLLVIAWLNREGWSVAGSSLFFTCDVYDDQASHSAKIETS